MTVVALATCSLLLLGTVVLLIREVRLRRALQQLLIRLLTLWRSLYAKDRPIAHDVDGADASDDSGGIPVRITCNEMEGSGIAVERCTGCCGAV